ncbi:YbaB/EbfC family nucleoid-associated protein [Mycolicibacterium bacteremicum]|uniref:DNA-binding protein n=1 Tax=Mycolicibacterium bacteremicum TaxID=564198 RepID=A0A1W9YQD7_MYCBA|nr:YbaB/EbfC family nucleoid-associated protein [Mycolicibacterium bacteremicum]MCV7432769.1 YbaB/EbfC family nucleoid-associated protein [Mycolicibacterium bacteremicum]ORA02275.1 DNA-binding protein [Mycolicibacterium bacteremicum]
MSEPMHPEVAAVLRQAGRLQELMDEQLHKMATESFTATDESHTVEVTLNGHHRLVDVYLADGLLRLGSGTVQERLNEALRNATEVAAESIAADRDRLNDAVAEITGT